ncbi:MAG: gluconate 2-dehydrogenase subunit 3 family protein [Methylocystis silviterrae]|uniref:gluconate 2-dehydrogenase subunit 3 family protein n=1 Tax=Methylocystis silviterrae TaxID=2743612 RepID=UPI003C77602D
MDTPYRGYDVLAKWDTVSFDDRTREELSRRLRDVPKRRFLTKGEFELLAAIVERLAPVLCKSERQSIAHWIDDRLFHNVGEGFRYAGEPPMRESWRKGLAAIDGEARRLFAVSFTLLDGSRKDATLRAIQRGVVDAALWRGLRPSLFFSHTLLKAIAGLAYAQPSAWSDIGFGGPASPRGYVRLGFNQRDPWEAKESR